MQQLTSLSLFSCMYSPTESSCYGEIPQTEGFVGSEFFFLPLSDFCIEGSSFNLVTVAMLLEVGPGVFTISVCIRSHSKIDRSLLHHPICETMQGV